MLVIFIGIRAMQLHTISSGALRSQPEGGARRFGFAKTPTPPPLFSAFLHTSGMSTAFELIKHKSNRASCDRSQ